MDEPLISVIITSHRGKHANLLKDAIQSVLNQDLDRRWYEIVVVKDYPDSEVDYIARTNSVRIVDVREDSIGYMLRVSIEEASGPILAFLDDDDMYLPEKLSFVKTAFERDSDVVFFHNYRILSGRLPDSGIASQSGPREALDIRVRTSEVNSTLFRKMLSQHGIMSCIAVKREIIVPHLNALEKLTTKQDTFFFLLALLSDGSLRMSRLPLTFYRFGESVTRILASYNEYWKRIEQIHEGDLTILRFLDKISLSSHLRPCVASLIAEQRIDLILILNRRNIREIARSVNFRSLWIQLINRPLFVFALGVHTISPLLFRKVHYFLHINGLVREGLTA